MKIKNIDRSVCKDVIRPRLNDALLKLGDALGVTFQVGNMSYTGTNANIKVVCSVQDASGNTISKEAEDFKRHAPLHGIPESKLGALFAGHGGTGYTIVGYKPRSSKYPILAKQVMTGKMYKFDIQTVKRALNLH